MSTTHQKKGFLAQMLAFFGRHPGQSFNEFGEEVKALTDDDRQEIWQLLNAAGYSCEPPSPVQQPLPAA